MSNIDLNPGVLAFGAEQYAKAQTDNLIGQLRDENIALHKTIKRMTESHKALLKLMEKYRFEADYNKLVAAAKTNG